MSFSSSPVQAPKSPPPPPEPPRNTTLSFSMGVMVGVVVLALIVFLMMNPFRYEPKLSESDLKRNIDLRGEVTEPIVEEPARTVMAPAPIIDEPISVPPPPPPPEEERITDLDEFIAAF